MKTVSNNLRTNDLYSSHRRKKGKSHATTNSPGRLFSELIGEDDATDVNEKASEHSDKARDPVDKWAAQYKIDYEPVSELATLSQAYCSIFWDPNSTWMVVAFK